MIQTIDLALPSINFFTRERLDPVITAVLALLGRESDVVWYVALQQILFFVGLFTLFSQEGRREEGFWSALGAHAVVVLAIGVDPAAFRIQWLPFLLAWGGTWGERTHLGFIRLALSAALFSLWCLTAGAVGIFGYILLALLHPRHLPFFFLLSAVTFAAQPIYSLAEYPSDARLATISPLTFEGDPLIGPRVLPNPIDYSALKKTLLESSARVAWSGAVLFLVALWRRERAFALRIGGVFALTILCVAFEGIFPAAFAYAPVRVVYRIVPGAILAPLPWLLFPFLLLPFWLEIRSRGGEVVRWSGVLLFLSLGVVWGIGKSSLSLSQEKLENTHLSPSRLVDATIPAALAQRHPPKLQKLRPGRDFEWECGASERGDECVLAIDGDLKTRWTTGRSQNGDEWFEVRFDRPIPLAQIALSPGGGGTDFPRGIVVKGVRDSEQFAIFSERDWSGPVRWSAGGQRYWGPQGDVSLLLPKVSLVDSLRIEQVGREGFFNWSVAEIEVYTGQ